MKALWQARQQLREEVQNFWDELRKLRRRTALLLVLGSRGFQQLKLLGPQQQVHFNCIYIYI